jgi:hypothetical protein
MIGQSVLAANPELTWAQLDRLSLNVFSRRLTARGREVVCGGDQHEVARLKNDRLMTPNLEAAGTGQNRAVERAPSFRTPDPPESCPFDNFRI